MYMINMDNFAGNPFNPFLPKFDDSVEEDEEEELEDDDDDDEDFDYDGQLDDEGYELDDEYDEGNMMDVKPPVGVNAGNNATGIPIDNGEKYVYVLILPHRIRILIIVLKL